MAKARRDREETLEPARIGDFKKTLINEDKYLKKKAEAREVERRAGEREVLHPNANGDQSGRPRWKTTGTLGAELV